MPERLLRVNSATNAVHTDASLAPPGAEVKRVLVCADDFGLHPAVDEGILNLAEKGRLSAASCLVDGPSFVDDASALLASGLQCGLHLNFTETMGAAAMCMPLGRLIGAAWLRRLDAASVRAEIARQLDRYEDVMARPPDYVDGHQHVHQFPLIREALLDELLQRYSAAGLPWLRNTRAAPQGRAPMGIRHKARIIALLGAGSLCRLAREHGFRMNHGFLGVYGFGGGADGYARLLRVWLAAARDGDLVMCHPASEAVPGDPLGDQRVAEYRVWASDGTGEWLSRLGVSLAGRSGAA